MVFVPVEAVGADGVPVKAGLAKGAFRPIEFDMVVLKAASSPKAAASSFKVFKVAGAESSRFATAVVVNAVVAICVVLVAAVAVGAVGVPVKAALVNIVALLSFVTLLTLEAAAYDDKSGGVYVNCPLELLYEIPPLPEADASALMARPVNPILLVICVCAFEDNVLMY